MRRLHEHVKNNEDWLMSRILSYAKEHNYVKYTSTLKEAWRLSISGLSNEMLKVLDKDKLMELGAEDDYSKDPVACIGMLQARKHRQRGVSLGMFLGLSKYYRQSYVDLVYQAHFEKKYEKKYLLFIERFFDRFEIGVSSEWAQIGKSGFDEELRMANLSMTNEKNKYLTIFESLGTPVILLDNNIQINNMNHAAAKLFQNSKTPGVSYYGKGTAGGSLLWLSIELEAFAAGNSDATCFTKEYKCNDNSRYFEVKLRRMLDVSEKFAGIVVILNDITNYKQSQWELQSSYKELDQIFNTAADGMRVVDKNFNTIKVNDMFSVLSGVSKEEAIGKKCYQVFPGPLCHTPDCCLTRIKNGEKRVECDVQKENIDGTKIPCIVTVTPFRAPDGELLGIVEGFKDITERKQSEEILKRYQILFKHARDIILFVRHDGQIIEANDAAVKEYGYSRNELLSKNINDLRAVSTQVSTERQMEQASTTGILFETEHRRKDGSTFPVGVNSQGTVIEGERILLSIIRDISERKQAEQRLRAAHQQLLDIIEFLPDAAFVVDENRRVIAWNRAMEAITGIEGKDILGKDNEMYSKAFYGHARPILIDLIISGPSRKKWPYEFVQREGNALSAEGFAPALLGGKGATIWGKASPLFDSGGNLVGAIETVRDITERKQIEKKLTYLSFHDPLTCLCNRTYFEQKISRLDKEECYPSGIIVCDVDGLKIVNDTIGHDAGDKLLQAAANIIKESFRENDLIFRMGGDEFAVLLPQSDEAIVENAVLRIRDGIKNYNDSNPEFPLYISLGFAVRDSEPIAIKDLFKIADNNMYREKLHHSQSTRSGIVQTLAKAMEARDFVTEGHGDRIQNLVVALSLALGLSKYRVSDLRLFARFHDIGKVGIPDRILSKPGPLTTEEMYEMRRHCEIGHRIALSASDLAPIADWILKHHEWWNAGGYPLGLKGDAIPLECRILTICDAYDAMTSDRPYRKAMHHKDAIEEIKRFSGVQFDPSLVHKFVSLMNKNMPNIY